MLFLKVIAILTLIAAALSAVGLCALVLALGYIGRDETT